MVARGITVQGLYDVMELCGDPNVVSSLTVEDLATNLLQCLSHGTSLVEYMSINGNGVVKPAQYAVWHAKSDRFIDIVNALDVRLGRDASVWLCLLGEAPTSPFDQAVVVWQCWLKPCCATCIKSTKTKRMLRREKKTLRLHIALDQDDEARYLVEVAKGEYLVHFEPRDEGEELGNIPATQGDLKSALVAVARDRVEHEPSTSLRVVWHYVLGVHKVLLGLWDDAAVHFQSVLSQSPESLRRMLQWQVLLLTASIRIAQSTEPIGLDWPVFRAVLVMGGDVELLLGASFVLAKLLVRHEHDAVGLRVGLLALAWQKKLLGNYHEMTAPLLQFVVDQLVFHSQVDQIADWVNDTVFPIQGVDDVESARSACRSHQVDTMGFIRDFEVVLSTEPVSSGDLWHEDNGSCEICRCRIRGTRLVNFTEPLDTKWACRCHEKENARAGRTFPIRPPARYYREYLLDKAARHDMSATQLRYRHNAEFDTYQRYCDLHHIPTREREKEKCLLGVTPAFFAHCLDTKGGRAALEGLSVDQVCRHVSPPSTKLTGLALVDQFTLDKSTRHFIGVARVFVSYDPNDSFLAIVDALQDQALPADTAFWFRSFSTKLLPGQPSWKVVEAAIRSSATFWSVWTSWRKPSAVCKARCVIETWMAAKAQVEIVLCVSRAQTIAFRDFVVGTPFYRYNATTASGRFHVLPDVKCVDSGSTLSQLDKDEQVPWLQSSWTKCWESLYGVVQAIVNNLVLTWIGKTWSDSNHETRPLRLYVSVCLNGHEDKTALPDLQTLESLMCPSEPILWRVYLSVAHSMAGVEDARWESTFLRGLTLAKAHLGGMAVEVLDAEHALGLLHKNAGQTTAALDVLESCYGKKALALGRYDVSTLTTAAEVGLVQILGQRPDAVDYLFTVLCDLRRVLPDNHTILQHVRAIVVEGSCSQGKYHVAHQLALEGFAHQVRLTPAMNDDATLQRLGQLVTVLLRRGRFELAEKHLAKWNAARHGASIVVDSVLIVPHVVADVQLHWALLYWGTGDLDRAQTIFELELETNASPDAARAALFPYYELLLRRGQFDKANVVWAVKSLFKQHTAFNEVWPYVCQACFNSVVGTRVTCTACPVLATTYCVQCFETSNRRMQGCAHENAFEHLVPPPRYLLERHLALVAAASKAAEYHDVLVDLERYCQAHDVAVPRRTPITPTSNATTISILKESMVHVDLQKSVGLTLGFFKRLVDMHGGRAQFLRLTTRVVAKTIVMPFTRESKLSLVEHVVRHDPESDKYVKKASIFVSHSWDYLFLDVVDALDHYMHENGFDDDTAVWFCTFCNNQHLVNSDTPPPFEFWVRQFQDALTAIGNVVMVFDRWNRPGALSRAWCVFEVWVAVLASATFDVAMTKAQMAAFTTERNGSVIYDAIMGCIQCEESTTTVAQDRVDIFHAIETGIGFPKLNKTVLGVVQKWVLGITQRRIDTANGLAQANWLASKAVMCDMIGDYAESLRSFDRIPASNGPFNSSYVSCVASVKFALQRPRHEWEPDMLEAIETEKDDAGYETQHAVNMRYQLAQRYVEIRAFDQAVLQFDKVWTIQQRTLGAGHAFTLHTMMCLGKACCKNQDYNRGISLLLQCLDMVMADFDEDSAMMCSGVTVGFLMGGGKQFVDQAEELGWPYQLWLARQDDSSPYVNEPDLVSHERWVEWVVENDRSLLGHSTNDNDIATAQQILWGVATLYRDRGQLDKAMDLCAQLVGTSTSIFDRKCFTYMGAIQADCDQYAAAKILLEQAVACDDDDGADGDVVLMRLFDVMTMNNELETLDAIDAFQKLCIAHDYYPHEGWSGMSCSMCKEEIVGHRIVCLDCPFDSASLCASCVPSIDSQLCSHTRKAGLLPPGRYLRQKRLHLLQVEEAWDDVAEAELEYRSYCEMFGIP